MGLDRPFFIITTGQPWETLNLAKASSKLAPVSVKFHPVDVRWQ